MFNHPLKYFKIIYEKPHEISSTTFIFTQILLIDKQNMIYLQMMNLPSNLTYVCISQYGGQDGQTITGPSLYQGTVAYINGMSLIL